MNTSQESTASWNFNHNKTKQNYGHIGWGVPLTDQESTWRWLIMMPTLSSLMEPYIVIMTTSGAMSDDKVGIMISLGFQFLFYIICQYIT